MHERHTPPATCFFRVLQLAACTRGIARLEVTRLQPLTQTVTVKKLLQCTSNLCLGKMFVTSC